MPRIQKASTRTKKFHARPFILKASPEEIDLNLRRIQLYEAIA
jgi:hypothetical protein